MKKIMLTMMLLSLGASNAYAVGPCSQVCAGPSEPCKMRCYLPGPFVTTCDQLAGNVCVRLPLAEVAEESEPIVCDAEPEVVPVVTAWIHAGMLAAQNVASVFAPVLG